jgi:hypothetical protein
MVETAVVTLCDEAHLARCARTIADVRSTGRYWGDLVLVAVDFLPPQDFIDFYRLHVRLVAAVDTVELVEQIHARPFTGGDGRELEKTVQWSKLHMFDPWFKQWRRVLFVDAGFRILDRLDFLLDLPWRGWLTAMDDAHPEGDRRFGCQLETVSNPDALVDLERLVPEVMTRRYFLNCLWIYDTDLTDDQTLPALLDLMVRFPICRTNEMGVMNVYFAFLKRVWRPLEMNRPSGLPLIDWTERGARTWRDYVGLKYPTTIIGDGAGA